MNKAKQMVPVRNVYEKALNHKAKIIMFDVQHLNENIAKKMRADKLNAYDIDYENVHAIYRDWASYEVMKGYSVIFTHNNKTQILVYNV